jgi:hypothetical protein
MKTTAEIIGEHQRNAGEIMLGYEDAKQEIREGLQLEEGAYLERLTSEQRFAALREQKIERAQEAYRQTLEAYIAEVERYHDELAQRRTYLKGRLFGEQNADRIERVALASDEELARLMDRAALAESRELAQAVFMEASERGAGDLMARYFDEVDSEARSLYAEWSELPTQERLERQVEEIERVVQPPDYERLMPTARTPA